MFINPLRALDFLLPSLYNDRVRSKDTASSGGSFFIGKSGKSFRIGISCIINHDKYIP